ncbi:MAG TPA: hypothetical protein VLA13_05830, partial [Massilibacterium sp.]|nr:hypothetical protein [Massilibacterium sp.]
MTERKNLFFFYKQDPYLMAKIDPLIELAKKYGFKVVDHHKDANIIVSFGNDGSFLQSVRKTGFRDDCLYVGIGTKPQNFYCDFHLNDVRRQPPGDRGHRSATARPLQCRPADPRRRCRSAGRRCRAGGQERRARG